MKIIVLVLGIVLTAMFANVYATSAVVEQVVTKVMATAPGRR